VQYLLAAARQGNHAYSAVIEYRAKFQLNVIFNCSMSALTIFHCNMGYGGVHKVKIMILATTISNLAK